MKRHAAAGDRGFRLRVAIHVGDVHLDRKGTFGEDIDITVRLLDSPEPKNRLRQTDAPLVVVVSDQIFRSVVRHGYDGIDDRDYEPLVQLDIGGWQQRGWVHVHVPEDGSRSMSAGRTA